MSILDRVYSLGLGLRRNGFLLALSLLSLFLLMAFTIFMVQLKFWEVYQSTAEILPLHKHSKIIQNDGVIKSNYVRLGLNVVENQLLVELDVKDKKAELARSEELLHYLSHKASKIDGKTRSIQQFNLAQEIAKLGNKITQLKREIRYSKLKSPIDGTIVRSDIVNKKGGFIKKGAVIADIISTKDMVAMIAIDPSFVGKVKVGQNCLIGVRESEFEERLSIKEIIIKKIDEKYHTFALADIPNHIYFKAGMNLKIKVYLRKISIIEMLKIH